MLAILCSTTSAAMFLGLFLIHSLLLGVVSSVVLSECSCCQGGFFVNFVESVSGVFFEKFLYFFFPHMTFC